jgi:hypothetical protein
MAVMTHAHHQAQANYSDLDLDTQERFDHAMELADDNRDNGEYLALMLAAAALAGLRIPYGADIRRCGCSCYCPVIFQTRPDTHVIEYGQGYNLGRVQCDTCADDHRETA